LKKTLSWSSDYYIGLVVYSFDGSVKVDFVTLDDDIRFEKLDYSYANPFYIGAAYAFEKAYNIVF